MQRSMAVLILSAIAGAVQWMSGELARKLASTPVGGHAPIAIPRNLHCKLERIPWYDIQLARK